MLSGFQTFTVVVFSTEKESAEKTLAVNMIFVNLNLFTIIIKKKLSSTEKNFVKLFEVGI